MRVGFPWARVLSAAIALPLALAAVLAGGWAFVLLVGGLVFLGQREYFALARAKGIAPAAKTTDVCQFGAGGGLLWGGVA
ncbi:MAG: phosphatidate cytidylyltransferase, partial [Oscillatoriales cyanobacterium SM2_1_8]|nr:phosphatidate cytidylyltransferase [Oscillatoriales cyanobacterium SM2_1_8]